MRRHIISIRNTILIPITIVFHLVLIISCLNALKIGGGVGYGYMESSNDLFKATVEPNSYPNLPNFASSTIRLRLAARYDFANGIWMKAEYGHLISTAQGMNDNSIKSADHFCFETGLDF